MKHKHYDCIVAWADGAEIEYKSPFGWQTAQSPAWTPCDEYRIKPEPKPDVVKYVETRATPFGICKWDLCSSLNANLRLTFDGETGNLKSAEVLK